MTDARSRSLSQDSAEESKVWPEAVMGGKYVRLLEKHLRQLRDQDAHGNRALFLDDVFVVYLLAFFNPTIRSLRTIEDFSQTVQARKHLSLRTICKSTLSDFNQLVAPQRLAPILAALRGQLGRKQAGRGEGASGLQTLLKQTVAVDGTFLPAMAEVAWAIAHSNNHGAVRHRARIDARLHVDTWLPEALVVPDAGQSEADSAIVHLQPGKIYLYDRGYMSFALLAAHHEPADDLSEEHEPAARSRFVVRFKPVGVNSPELQQAEDRPLTEADRQAGVVSDRVGYFTSAKAQSTGLSRFRVREVVIECEHNGEKTTVRLVTNLLDVSAAVVGLLYRYRWQVELFFRWFKSFGNFAHLISHRREGVLAHLYVTVIAAMLMYLHSGFQPSKYLFVLMSQVAAGGATLEEIMPILQERERRSELDRQSKARRAAKKKAQAQ